MLRSSTLSLALAPFLLLACGDDDGGGRADADIIDTPDASIDGSIADAGDEPDAADDPDGALPDAMPDDGRLLITEVVSGPMVGRQPKFVELTNTGGSPVDLSEYSLAIFANGSTTIADLGEPPAALVLSGTVAPGDSWVLHLGSGEPATFSAVYGEPADAEDSLHSFSGDDAVALFVGPATGDGSDATLVDVYGVIGVDAIPDEGAAEVWAYEQGYATRVPASVEPAATFAPGDWTFSGVEALLGLDAAGIAAVTSPGSHDFD